MLYGQVGREISARPIAPVWPQPVQISSSANAGGHAIGLWDMLPLFLLLLHHPSLRMNPPQTESPGFMHPSAYRGKEVQAPRQHSRILLTPATCAPRSGFTDQPMVGLAAETRVECRGGEQPP